MEKKVSINSNKQITMTGLFHQIICEKHDFTVVTQTTSTSGLPENPPNIVKNWLQCKNCGKTIPLPSQSKLDNQKQTQ